MSDEKKIEKIYEMLKKLVKMDAFEDGEIDKMYRAILDGYCIVKAGKLIEQADEPEDILVESLLKGDDKE